jgi:phage terminase large subunit
MQKPIRAVAGGTAASKTISILVWLIDYANSSTNKLVTVVSESYPHLEDGAMRDFENIMKDRNYWEDDRWHGTRHDYTFETGTIIQFKSIDTYGKAHGPRRDVLFINECNNLEYKIADQLITRTRETIWLDWNPTSEFWFYTEMLPFRDDIEFITLTYLDNEALLFEMNQRTIKEIEAHRHNKKWWKVYAEGQLGDVEGRIFTGWNTMDEVPPEAKLVRRGLDFGFSADPLALVDVYKWNGSFILDERLYGLGIHNSTVAEFINNCEEPTTLVFADSSEPKSIDEMVLLGAPVVGAHKGQGSIRHGIDFIQDQRIFVTRRSLHILKEYRAYMWEFDKNGEQTTTPQDFNNHCMDAIRYALETYSTQNNSRETGVVNAGPVDEKKKSFIVNDKGEAEAFHVDLGAVLHKNQQPHNRDWRHQ